MSNRVFDFVHVSMGTITSQSHVMYRHVLSSLCTGLVHRSQLVPAQELGSLNYSRIVLDILKTICHFIGTISLDFVMIDRCSC